MKSAHVYTPFTGFTLHSLSTCGFVEQKQKKYFNSLSWDTTFGVWDPMKKPHGLVLSTRLPWICNKLPYVGHFDTAQFLTADAVRKHQSTLKDTKTGQRQRNYRGMNCQWVGISLEVCLWLFESGSRYIAISSKYVLEKTKFFENRQSTGICSNLF